VLLFLPVPLGQSGRKGVSTDDKHDKAGDALCVL